MRVSASNCACIPRPQGSGGQFPGQFPWNRTAQYTKENGGGLLKRGRFDEHHSHHRQSPHDHGKNCAILSSPLLILVASCLHSLPLHSVAPKLSWSLSERENVRVSAERLKNFSGLDSASTARPDSSTLAILQPPKKASFCLWALVFRIFRLVLRGRDEVQGFTFFSCSSSVAKTFAIDWVWVPPSRTTTGLCFFFLWFFNVDTFCTGFLTMVSGLAVVLLCSAISVNVARWFLRSYIELCKCLDPSKAFLERMLSLLLLLFRQICLLCTTNTKLLCLRPGHCCRIGTETSWTSFRSLLEVQGLPVGSQLSPCSVFVLGSRMEFLPARSLFQ